MAHTSVSPEDRNSRVFILFRIFFNCRLYYPIFTILFLDFGLTLEQFSLLNVVWAMSIVLFEVPSGALADIIGRKRLVVYAAFLMILEMAVLLFTPRMSPIVFWLFLLNRILSGMAEASASGADEALVYDSIAGDDKDKKWNLLIAKTMKYQSVFMVIAMLAGAFLYDWNLVDSYFPIIKNYLNRDMALRIPIAINFVLAICCFLVSTRFVEESSSSFNFKTCKNSVVESFKQIGVVASYIAKSRSIFPLLFIGLVLDSSTRMFITLGSKYYRLLGIQESLYGVLGSLMAIMGILSSTLGARLVHKWSLKVNFSILVFFSFVVFVGILFVKTKMALVFVFLFALVMFLLGYFMSFYLNAEAPSKMRATLLSFKGLSFNLAYGWIGLLYARVAAKSNDSFQDTLPFFYKYFLLMLGAFIVIQALHKKFYLNKR